jgi:hypothetical protein
VRLAARDDIDVPQDKAFRALANVEYWERAALRKGASVLRTDTLPAAAPGMEWQVGFVWRGRPRSLTIRLVGIEEPHALRFQGVSPSFEGWMTIETLKMGPRHTRLAVKLEVRPRTLASRLFLQSARLAKGRINRNFEAAVAQLGAAILNRQARG